VGRGRLRNGSLVGYRTSGREAGPANGEHDGLGTDESGCCKSRDRGLRYVEGARHISLRLAKDDDGRSLIVLYVGDYDPSGMFMSVHDLPDRPKKYDDGHVGLRRIALKQEQTQDLLSFPASDKKGDKRYKWFVRNFGAQCWESDAMDPNDLRGCVKREIKQLIEPVTWKRCEVVNKAEQESLRHVLDRWKGAKR
jgi:hypothetical protein